MTDSTKISTLMDDARECEQPDAMVERTGEQPQSSAESTANGVASNSITTTPSATTAPSSMLPAVLTSEDSSSKRPDDEEKQQQQASQAADATKEVAVTVKNHDDDRVLAQLARQLEYYFSCQNLAKDTYVQTLRKLNSGCVPVAILANFSKVKLLLSSSSEEEARVRAVLQACTDHSQGRLRVVSIDTGSGKIVTNNDSANTILAIGTHDNEPLTISDDASMMATTPTSSKSVVFLPSSPLGGSGAANTLILRDVIPQVTEQDIQALFTFEGCPSVESIRQDVGNCW
jgi:La domain